MVQLEDGFDIRLSELPSGAPELFKLALSLHYPGQFEQRANVFWFVPPASPLAPVPMDFTPAELVSDTASNDYIPLTIYYSLPMFQIRQFELARLIPTISRTSLNWTLSCSK